MKLTTQDITSLRVILGITDLIGIEAIAIENGKVSGINADKTALLLTDQNIPQLNKGLKLGLTRLKEFKSRLDLFQNDDLTIELKENSKKEISQLELKGPGASVSFRAASTSSFIYPKNVEDEVVRVVIIQKPQAKMILDAGKAMGAANIGFTFKSDDEVNVEFTDNQQDTFNITLVDKVETLGETDTNKSYFVFSVFAPLLRAALNAGDEVLFQVCSSSALITVNGHDVRLMSQTEI